MKVNDIFFKTYQECQMWCPVFVSIQAPSLELFQGIFYWEPKAYASVMKILLFTALSTRTTLLPGTTNWKFLKNILVIFQNCLNYRLERSDTNNSVIN